MKSIKAVTIKDLTIKELTIKDLTKFEIEILCWQRGFNNLLPFIRSLSLIESKQRILEILAICWLHKESALHWPEWYRLSQIKLKEKPTVKKAYYYPGYFFQRKFSELWDVGFEYRYARRTSIRAFLLSSYRKSQEFNVNISADLCSHILSFLLPQEIGIEIEIQRTNINITKKKNYLVETYNMNHCRVGHTTNSYNSCPQCMALETEYLDISRKLYLSLNTEELPKKYQMFQDYEISLPQRKWEIDFMKIKHEIKLERLSQRATLRQEVFQNC